MYKDICSSCGADRRVWQKAKNRRTKPRSKFNERVGVSFYLFKEDYLKLQSKAKFIDVSTSQMAQIFVENSLQSQREYKKETVQKLNPYLILKEMKGCHA